MPAAVRAPQVWWSTASRFGAAGSHGEGGERDGRMLGGGARVAEQTWWCMASDMVRHARASHGHTSVRGADPTVSSPAKLGLDTSGMQPPKRTPNACNKTARE